MAPFAGLASLASPFIVWVTLRADWAARLTTYYRLLERVLTPSLFVVGGGVSKHADQFLPMVDVATPMVPAVLRNKAGIVGAALSAVGG